MSDSPLENDFDGSLEEEISKEEALAHYMASLGFRPKTARAKDTLEYFKTYSDSSGRIGRVVAVIKRDEMGLDPQSLEYITMTVQIHISATESEIRSKAPTFCRQDALRILAHFDEPSDRQEADVVECALCGMNVAEWIPKGEEKVCLDCSKRKGLT
jgi:hypothetical protein